MAINYNLEIEFLKKVEDNNNRTALTVNQIEDLLSEFPKLPEDYITYLQEVGSGSFRNCQFNIASSLFNLEDLGLENHYELKSNIWFFGDNFSGDFSGFDFDRNDGKIVEFWHESGELYYTNKSFQTYIREQMLMDENDIK
ncbi:MULTISPECIES: SMI1/KNR4 family protein [Flavobacterium]|uniref:Knr4/Smi1-like domain-containing protein n=1 Tax=Flavobacterium ginsengisoli TaxID=871694 RepID=A0ABP7G563_9FLAO|nr:MULTISPECIES: SMI1/KNR4 family protein [Flavobacterium]MBJ2123716.1 SMI1/KNR4 family protein [Flavobacterium sp. IB48]